jgi:sortase A
MQRLAFSERLCWLVGLVCIGSGLFVSVRAFAYRNAEKQILHRPTLIADTSRGFALGTIEISALALSAPIAPDIDADSLRVGVGHIRGTAVPGGLGTVGLAGHRDSFFRPLRRILPGMDIALTDHTGKYHYTVDSTEIVTPDKVHVLDIAQRPTLILITCFPFDYIGAAPRRFIVHAHLLSAAPDRKLAIR